MRAIIVYAVCKHSTAREKKNIIAGVRIRCRTEQPQQLVRRQDASPAKSPSRATWSTNSNAFVIRESPT
eukprot:230634-Lingulodinium_polyedra.AAC.1